MQTEPRSATVAGIVNSLLDDMEHEDTEERWRKVVSIRLHASDIQELDEIAKALGLTRTGCATQLLEAAISEARLTMMDRGVLPRMGGHVHFEQGEAGEIVYTTEDGQKTVIKDDALIVGEDNGR